MPKGQPPKKPVVSIRGSYRRDALTDEDYGRAVELQAATLLARQEETRYLLQIRERLLGGAEDTGSRWFYDFSLGIVRRRERKVSQSRG